jgi:hypothetical protein
MVIANVLLHPTHPIAPFLLTRSFRAATFVK